MNNELVKKYVLLYVKRNTILTLALSMFVFLFLFIASLFYKVNPDDILSFFMIFLYPLPLLLFSFLYIIRFTSMIKKQEIEFQIPFNDENVQKIDDTIFVSDHWLINAGSCAFYKGNIAKLTYKEIKGQPKVIITTNNEKKYSFWCRCYEDLDDIRKWYHAKSNNTDQEHDHQ